MAAETEVCGNCGASVPSANLATHSMHCVRNIGRCKLPNCGMVMAIAEFDAHYTAVHAQWICPCGLRLEMQRRAEHQANECSLRLVPCLFCELPMMMWQLLDHQDYCGTRTEMCRECNRYIMLQDLTRHQATDCEYPPRRPRPNNATTPAVTVAATPSAPVAPAEDAPFTAQGEAVLASVAQARQMVRQVGLDRCVGALGEVPTDVWTSVQTCAAQLSAMLEIAPAVLADEEGGLAVTEWERIMTQLAMELLCGSDSVSATATFVLCEAVRSAGRVMQQGTASHLLERLRRCLLPHMGSGATTWRAAGKLELGTPPPLKFLARRTILQRWCQFGGDLKNTVGPDLTSYITAEDDVRYNCVQVLSSLHAHISLDRLLSDGLRDSLTRSAARLLDHPRADIRDSAMRVARAVVCQQSTDAAVAALVSRASQLVTRGTEPIKAVEDSCNDHGRVATARNALQCLETLCSSAPQVLGKYAAGILKIATTARPLDAAGARHEGTGLVACPPATPTVEASICGLTQAMLDYVEKSGHVYTAASASVAAALLHAPDRVLRLLASAAVSRTASVRITVAQVLTQAIAEPTGKGLGARAVAAWDVLALAREPERESQEAGVNLISALAVAEPDSIRPQCDAAWTAVLSVCMQPPGDPNMSEAFRERKARAQATILIAAWDVAAALARQLLAPTDTKVRASLVEAAAAGLVNKEPRRSQARGVRCRAQLACLEALRMLGKHNLLQPAEKAALKGPVRTAVEEVEDVVDLSWMSPAVRSRGEEVLVFLQ